MISLYKGAGMMLQCGRHNVVMAFWGVPFMIGICRNCGANLEPGATVCRRCGAEVTEEPLREPGFFQKLGQMLGGLPRRKLFWLVPAAALALVLLVLALSLGRGDSGQSEEPPVITLEPSPSLPAVSPEPSRSPQVNWAEIYRSFLETDPTINSQMLANAEEYGFSGTVTAELFALADINADNVPELLLALRPEALPGWNVNGQQGQAVERYIVCGIHEGRVSPLMCGKVDFGFYPLLLSVNNQWLLEQSRGEGTSHCMTFRSPQGQSSCRSLGYALSLEPRITSAGESVSFPVERWFADEERVVADQVLDTLFPQGADTLACFPVFFRELSPGCLDALESDWENREVLHFSRAELSKLRAAAGSDWADKGNTVLSCISEPYCISLTGDGASWVMVVGIDRTAGWDYVQSIQVESVSVEEGDAWVHDATAEGLPEGQVYQYVVGISPAGDQQPVLHSRIRVSFHDGAEITKEYVTQAP